MPGEEPARGLRGRRVLVVEDEFFIADDLEHGLREAGAMVLGPVPTRDEALALLAGAERPDLAVLDIRLEENLVFPVADALRERGVPFVFATGYGPGMVPERFRDVPRWEKPYEPDVLVRALAGLLAG